MSIGNTLRGRILLDPDSGEQGVVIEAAWARGGAPLVLLETDGGEFRLMTVTHLVCVGETSAEKDINIKELLVASRQLAEAAFEAASLLERGGSVRNSIGKLRGQAENVINRLKALGEGD